MTRDRQLLLGMFVLFVFVILAVYTLAFSDFSLFKEQHRMVVFFPDAHGLRRGDSVQVAGVRFGKVHTIVFDPGAIRDKRITVNLLLDSEVQLRQGFEIYIEDSTVLGGKNVYVDPGPAGADPVDPGIALFGRVKGGALDSLGKLVDENGDKISTIVADVQEVVADAKAGKGPLGLLLRDEAVSQQLKDGVASLKATAANAEAISNDIQAGRGVVGRLVKDEDLANKVQEIGDNLSKITNDFTSVSADMKEGKGTIGRLMKDEKLADDVAKAVETIRTISERINSGNGTLWRLIEDDTLAKNLETFSANLESGTLGKLFNNDEIYVKLSKIADDIAAATESIRTAQGTLGKLVMDKDLYEQISRALGVLTRTLEEYREAAPVTTFTSVLFGAF
jgi:phospholipid/cholesterol/gamma-HCH transport system substrate-binding protein